MSKPQNKLTAHIPVYAPHTPAEQRRLKKLAKKQKDLIAQFLLTPDGIVVDIYAKGRNLAAFIDEHIDSLPVGFAKQIEPLREALALLRLIEERRLQRAMDAIVKVGQELYGNGELSKLTVVRQLSGKYGISSNSDDAKLKSLDRLIKKHFDSDVASWKTHVLPLIRRYC